MIDYRAVVRVLGDARDDVLKRFKSLGGNRDRWRRPDWEAMSEALTRAEDAREGLTGRAQSACTGELRASRRVLELALWP